MIKFLYRVIKYQFLKGMSFDVLFRIDGTAQSADH